ncbi:TrkA family potassium uptake protein [Pleurocapsales cyanobacterium LEGE 10410]|nr:TrkA family potassium uptake protein [Pleurocapsales cyanobacterium LEGE 10410]
MYLIIVGAGAVTKQLISTAKEQGHKVAVIEKNPQRARDIMQEFDVNIFHADIAEGKILEEAGVTHADAIIATTNDDSVNLMAMVLGKQYGVKSLITLLQEREQQAMFEKLGIRVLSDPEKLIAQKLYSLIDLEK